MIDPTDPRIVAAMFSNDAAPEAKKTPISTKPLYESNIEPRANVNIIRLDKQAVAVPSMKYVEQLSKELTTVKTQAKLLANDNRQLKHILRTLAKEIGMLKLALDNKIDKS